MNDNNYKIIIDKLTDLFKEIKNNPLHDDKLISTSYNNIYRKLSDIEYSSDYQWEKIKIRRHIENLLFTKCHWGQLKLFYCELEFLTMCVKKYKTNKFIVFYPGAAPGIQRNLLKHFFPEVTWLLYDPNKFQIYTDDRFEIHTGEDGFVTDDTILKLLQSDKIKNKGDQKLLYISDIRLGDDDKSVFESYVFNDMIKQLRWGIMLKADAMLLKFRIPYIFDNSLTEIFSKYIYNETLLFDSIENIDEILLKNYSALSNPMVYLDGDIYTQLLPPYDSTETRLVVFKNDNNKYLLRVYDWNEYNTKCMYHNLVSRVSEKFQFEYSNLMKYHLAGYDDNYDSVCQYYLLYEYLNVYHNINRPSYVYVINLLFLINYFFEKIVSRNKTVAICNFDINYINIIDDVITDNEKHEFIDLMNKRLHTSYKICNKDKCLLNHSDYVIYYKYIIKIISDRIDNYINYLKEGINELILFDKNYYTNQINSLLFHKKKIIKKINGIIHNL